MDEATHKRILEKAQAHDCKTTTWSGDDCYLCVAATLALAIEAVGEVYNYPKDVLDQAIAYTSLEQESAIRADERHRIRREILR